MGLKSNQKAVDYPHTISATADPMTNLARLVIYIFASSVSRERNFANILK